MAENITAVSDKYLLLFSFSRLHLILNNRLCLFKDEVILMYTQHVQYFVKK